MTDQPITENTEQKPLWYLLYRDEAPEGLYEATFGGSFIGEIATLCGKKATHADLEIGLADSIDAFLSGKYDEEFHRSEKEENAALERVARSAENLHLALLDLYDFGRSSEKLASEIKRFKRFPEGSSPRTLLNLLRPEPRPLLLLQGIATDLAVGAEKAINRKPKADPERAAFAGENYTTELAQQTEEWRRRKATFKLRPTHAIVAFLEAFKPIWEQNSDHPFTEGMHYTETNTTLSPAVDAAHLILKKLDPSLLRSTIITGIKNLRRQDPNL
jgi:hypothetical protein